MKKSVFYSLIIIVGIVSLSAGYFANQWMNKSDGSQQARSNIPGPTVNVPDMRPNFSIRDLDGKLRNASEWDGKVLMINFWATWCPPCVREIPAFIKLQQDYADKGFSIVGIALDSHQAVKDFVDPMDVNYPILVAEEVGINLTKAYGNNMGILPYTVIVDRSGKVIYTHRSELTYADAEKVIKPLL